MAIFSLHHSTIGKGTQRRPYTASSHVRYITRREAMSRLEGARMPTNPREAQRYLDAQEASDRANARILDKVRLALPRELNAAQRAELVRAFAEEVTKGKASWLAAFHDMGKDENNPHCHLVIRDRDPESGRRVIGMSEAGSTKMLRERWEYHANRALELAGRSERVDRRTLKEQGIERAATIHEGPKARAAVARGRRPVSRAINVRNGPKTRSGSRQVDYGRIDQGRTRAAYNAQLAREAEYWRAIDEDAAARAVPEPPAPTKAPFMSARMTHLLAMPSIPPVSSPDAPKPPVPAAPEVQRQTPVALPPPEAVRRLPQVTERPMAPERARSEGPKRVESVEERNARMREELRRKREAVRELEDSDRPERQKSFTRWRMPDRGRDDDLER